MTLFRVWIHGQRGHTHEVEASHAVEAIERTARHNPFAYYRGETVELVAAPVLECGDLGFSVEKTIALAK